MNRRTCVNHCRISGTSSLFSSFPHLALLYILSCAHRHNTPADTTLLKWEERIIKVDEDYSTVVCRILVFYPGTLLYYVSHSFCSFISLVCCHDSPYHIFYTNEKIKSPCRNVIGPSYVGICLMYINLILPSSFPSSILLPCCHDPPYHIKSRSPWRISVSYLWDSFAVAVPPTSSTSSFPRFDPPYKNPAGWFMSVYRTGMVVGVTDGEYCRRPAPPRPSKPFTTPPPRPDLPQILPPDPP